jgi:maltooligosyltrehalose trehalohydrolase
MRLDALQEFYDDSDEHIVAALVGRARETASASGRSVLMVGEDEPQQARMLRSPEEGGFGLDALWNDDFHHVGKTVLTRRAEGYYGDYHGSPQEFVSLWKHGYLYQGQRNARQGKPRGSPTRGLPLRSFVNYLENHDQVANSLRGERLRRTTSPPLRRALTSLLLLSPGTPMLFQGQEFSASSLFHYFNDAGPDRREGVSRSRAEFLAQFPSLSTDEARAAMLDPADLDTFRASKIKDADRAADPPMTALHRDLIRLRRGDPVFAAQGDLGVDGAVLGPESFVLRHRGVERDDRVIVANLGADFTYTPISEPLLAPPEGREWQTLWSSESVTYGGDGTPAPLVEAGWRLPRQSTLVLAARPRKEGGG